MYLFKAKLFIRSLLCFNDIINTATTSSDKKQFVHLIRSDLHAISS